MTQSGCSPEDWIARVEIVRAESASDKGYQLKNKPGSEKQRAQYYREACGHFAKAYGRNPEVFSLNRIQQAISACKRTGQVAYKEMFLEFEEAYIQAHPKEYEFGDAGVGMISGE